MKKVLVAWYSRMGLNTEIIAKRVAEALHADMAKIDTVKEYKGDYFKDILPEGNDEVKRGIKPEIKPLKVNPADYDVIILGTPVWWASMAPAVHTFIDGLDWTGKTLVPFATHGGYPGHPVEDMTEACAGAETKLPILIRFDYRKDTGESPMTTPAAEVDAWIAEVKQLVNKG